MPISPSLSEKLQNFLTLLLEEMELQNSENSQLIPKTISITYKQLGGIFDDSGEIDKYLKYAQKQGLIKQWNVLEMEILSAKPLNFFEQMSAKIEARKYLIKYDDKQKIQKIVSKNSDIKTKNIKIQKTTIYISQKNGIYKNEATKMPSYPIKNRRSEIITHLKNGGKDGKILANLCYKSNFAELSKAISNINKIFKKILKLKDDLIIHIPTGGYELNNEKYNTRFNN